MTTFLCTSCARCFEAFRAPKRCPWPTCTSHDFTTDRRKFRRIQRRG